ncbi:DUF998 domain-containing protein [Lacisediminihabitans profunda]|nr:DUF998 domain-containing protein [Lacisediminihabitans profunda]
MNSRDAPRTRRVFATAAMALVVLYVLVDIVLQLLPPHYSVVTDAESDLAVGPFGWAMQVNFVARAVMSGCVVVVVTLGTPDTWLRRTGSALLAVAGLCSAALALLPTDVNAAGEYGMTPHTAVGFAHVVFATSGFLAVIAAMAVLTRGAGRQRAVLALFLVALAGLVLLALSLTLAPQAVGLAERLCLGGILGWAFALCGTLRNPAEPI